MGLSGATMMGEIGLGSDGEIGADMAVDFVAETMSDMDFDIAQDIDIEPDIALEPEVNLEFDLNVEPDVALEPEMDLVSDLDVEPDIVLEPGIDLETDFNVEPDVILEPEIDLEINIDLEPVVASEPEIELETDIDVEPDKALEPEIDLETDVDLEPGVASEPEIDLETDSDVEPGMDVAYEDDAATSEVELLETEIDLTEETDLAKGQEEHLRFGELESDQDYEINGYHYETDEFGRVEYVTGKLELGEAVRDLQEQGRVGREGVEGDEGGHYIGARFAGSPEGINLFPQDMNLNRGQWKAMENEWDRALQRGAEVETMIHSVYEGGDTRPMGLDVLYTIDGVTHQRSFVNVPQGQLL
jgi:hypothetical protein